MKRPHTICLAAIAWIALFLRLFRAGEMSLRADEASYLFIAAQDPAAIIRLFIASDPHLPLYYLVLHFWMLVAGRSELAARFPTIIAGVLVIPLVYVLGRCMFPRRRSIALVAALLAALNPYLVWDSQDLAMYSFLTTVALASFIAFWRLLNRSTWMNWVAYVVMSVLGLFVHYLAGLVLLAQGVLGLAASLTRQIAWRTMFICFAALLAVLLLYLPWLAFALPLLTNLKTGFLHPVTLFDMARRALIAFSVGRVNDGLMPGMVEPIAAQLFSTGFLPILFLGLFASFRSEQRGRAALVIFTGVPLLAVYLFSLWRFPVFDERYVLFLIPPFLLLIARGVARLSIFDHRWATAGALGFIVLASGHSLYNYYYVPAFAKSPDWRSFVGQLTLEARPGDAIIQNYPDPALPYYLNGSVPRVLFPHSSSDSADVVDADLKHVAAKYARLWLQPVPGGEWDRNGLVKTWLTRHALQLSKKDFHGLQLELYLPSTTALREATPIGATFAAPDGAAIKSIRLLAFNTNYIVEPGRTVRVNLFWMALTPGEREATVFLHLYDAEGKLRSQQDSAPVHATYPTSRWQTGEIVVDPYTLGLPESLSPGLYSLMTGLYDPLTLKRWDAVDESGRPSEENRVLLANLTVGGLR